MRARFARRDEKSANARSGDDTGTLPETDVSKSVRPQGRERGRKNEEGEEEEHKVEELDDDDDGDEKE